MARRRPLARSEAGAKCIIVELDEARTPEEQHGIARSQHCAGHGPQALRPFLDGPERGARPVEITTSFSHFPGCRKQRFGGTDLTAHSAKLADSRYKRNRRSSGSSGGLHSNDSLVGCGGGVILTMTFHVTTCDRFAARIMDLHESRLTRGQ